MKLRERTGAGIAADWHFRLAAGVFAAVVAGELAAQSFHGARGSGAWGWLALLASGNWVVGLVWRERVGVARAWSCWAWVTGMSFVAARLAQGSGFLFGTIEFTKGQPLELARVPLGVPMLGWLIVGGCFLVIEGLWGEWRAGVSTLTGLATALMAPMVLPVVCTVRGYWRWPAVFGDSPEQNGGLPGMLWTGFLAGFFFGVVLAFGLVLMGENLSSTEVRAGRQAWAPAAVILGLAIVCFGANVSGGLRLAGAFSAANAALFGAVVVRHLRSGGRSPAA